MPDGFSPESLPQQPIPEAPKGEPGVESEQGTERQVEKVQEKVGERGAQQPSVSSVVTPSVSATQPVSDARDEWKEQIVAVLDENLEDVIRDMSPAKQEEFRAAKQELAGKIRSMLDEAVVQFAAVLLLIRKWLSMIPRVNSFFLEQESKLKTDKIKKLAETLRAGRVA